MPPKPQNPKFVKACKAMKSMGYMPKVVKPVLEKLLKVYENNWNLIEDGSYQVLVDAILDSEEQKAQSDEFQHLNSWSGDKAEENEPPPKKSKLSRQEKQSTTSFDSPMPSSINEVENQPQKLPEPVYEKHQDVELKAPSVAKYSRVKMKSSGSPLYRLAVEQAKETNISHDNGSDISNTLAHLENNGGESDIHDFPEKGTITHERGSTPTLLLEYVRSTGNKSDLEGKTSESMDCGIKKNENDGEEYLKLDIASSSRGEVKLSLLAKSSARSDTPIPSSEALLKQVEEHCLKSCEIPPTGFSMLELMNDVCESFLAAGTTLASTEDVGPSDTVLALDFSRNTNSETGSADRQLSLCSTFSDNPGSIQNPFEVSPQIPRDVGPRDTDSKTGPADRVLSLFPTISDNPVSIQNPFEVFPEISFVGISPRELDLSQCRIYLNVDPKRFAGVERNLIEPNNYVPTSSRMMIVQKGYYQYISDVTEGQEAYEISLINELNEEEGPAFHYIPKNMTCPNEYARFLLSHVSQEKCCLIGDCLSLEFPCACAGKTGFEFAYTRECLLKEKFLDNVISENHSAIRRNLFYCEDCPIERCEGKIVSFKCKGHVARNFIKECWRECGCGFTCGNRVVQRGITAKLQVFMTDEQKGWGVRTLEDISKGAFICEYIGEVITSKESFERNMQNSGDELTYRILLDAGWSSKGIMKDGEALCLDATVYGNVARFINHRCFDANLVEIPVEVETPTQNYYHLALFTTRMVHAGEELTWDYGINFYDPVKVFECVCGSNFCRDRKNLKRKLSICQ